MEQLDFELGEGTVYLLADHDDWALLPPALRALVPTKMRQAWGEFPHIFREWSATATHRGLRKWLATAPDSTCRLRIYDTHPIPSGFGRAALLELSRPSFDVPVLLDFRSRATPSNQYPPTTSPWPHPVPQALREVHERVGGIQHDFGMSGSLVPPDSLTSITEWWPGVADILNEMGDNELRGLGGRPSAAELDRFLVVYESSSDYLCVADGGEGCWIGVESGIYERVDFDAALDAYFDALIEGRPFRPK